MSTIVLVHGAWIGGWAWRHVAAALREAGHDVYSPSLTGLGDRRHLATPEVGVDTHVADIVNLLELEELSSVTLAGHSYGGIVITSVADRVPQRIRRLVYVDAGVPKDGESLFSAGGPEYRNVIEGIANEYGGGWGVPIPRFEDLAQFVSIDGLGSAARAEFEAKAVPQPIKTFSQAVSLGNPATAAIPRTFIHCTADPQPSPLPWYVDEARTSRDWHYVQMPTGHWPMLSMPHELSAVLLAATEDAS